MTEDEMIGWHHRLDKHELEQALGVVDGQGSLACCSPWSCKESDTTGQLKNNNLMGVPLYIFCCFSLVAFSIFSFLFNFL